MTIKGTRTEKNILTAFAGESQARNRYTFFASQAKKDGFEAIGKIFEETAGHEKEHAERMFKFLEGGELEIKATYPAGKIGATLENLRHAAFGEHEENTELYPAFAEVAAEEGFSAIADMFREIGHAERYHEARYTALANAIEKGTLFKSAKPVMWRCTNCGNWVVGTDAPELCPACVHTKGYFISEATLAECDTNEGFCSY